MTRRLKSPSADPSGCICRARGALGTSGASRNRPPLGCRSRVNGAMFEKQKISCVRLLFTRSTFQSVTQPGDICGKRRRRAKHSISV